MTKKRIKLFDPMDNYTENELDQLLICLPGGWDDWEKGVQGFQLGVFSLWVRDILVRGINI